MSNPLEEFEKQEAAAKASARQLNEWSKTLIGLLIQEQEQKMQASNLPVDPEKGESFWQDPGETRAPGGASLE
jgi:hypothetical protein